MQGCPDYSFHSKAGWHPAADCQSAFCRSCGKTLVNGLWPGRSRRSGAGVALAKLATMKMSTERVPGNLTTGMRCIGYAIRIHRRPQGQGQIGRPDSRGTDPRTPPLRAALRAKSRRHIAAFNLTWREHSSWLTSPRIPRSRRSPRVPAGRRRSACPAKNLSSLNPPPTSSRPRRGCK